MNLESTLAKRFFRSRHYPRLPARSSVLAVSGIAAGVISLILVLSIMGGFERSLQERTLKLTPHVEWQPPPISSSPMAELLTQLKAAQFQETGVTMHPISEGPALGLGAEISSPVTVFGVTKEFLPKLKPYIVHGDFQKFENEPRAVLGIELANELDVGAGEWIDIVNPFENDSVFLPLPLSRRFRVAAVVKTGLFEADQRGFWVAKPYADRFFGFSDERSRLTWWLEKPAKAEIVAGHIKEMVQAKLGTDGGIVQTWKDTHRTLFDSMRIEQRSMFFLLLGVIAVASLNITILLTMMVNDRKPFIGMLMTMGLNRERVARIFSLYGVRLGLIGTGVGVFLGLTIAFFFKYVPLVRLPSVYYDQSLPIDVKPVAVILVCISSFVIAVAASYLPSRRASKLDPIEAIRIGR